MLGEDILFSATTVHLEHITTALNCLTPFGNKDDVLIIIDNDGLSFASENNHVVKIQLFLSKELFMSYNYRAAGDDSDSHTKLCVKINHILDSVSVVSRDKDDIVECTLSYNGEGSPFILIFEDSLITEKVEYSTYLLKNIDNTGLELDRDQVAFECMIKGEVLYSALKDLKEIGCKECYTYALTGSNGRNMFALISKGQLGLSKILLPSERSILEKMEVYDGDSSTILYDTPCIGFFDFSTFDKIRISTKIASKVLFRKDVHGLLNINILSQTDDVIIADTKYSNSSLTSSKKSVQLPKDYPGIVIEISMLEKMNSNEVKQRDLELMMESKDDKKIGLSYNPSTSEGLNPTRSKHLADVSIDLFGPAKRRHLEQSQGQTDDEEDQHYQPANGEIPLFF